MKNRRRVLLVELNEITWKLIDPLIEQGKLPTFARLKSEGVWGAPTSVDLGPQLDPWITWTTVYSGRPQAAHNVFFLQQPPETIAARRLWEICDEHGLRVGVFGSLCSWPPQAVNGFYVPDTFAPDSATHPDELRPIQELNLTYTRSVRLPSDQDGMLFKARLGAKLIKLGLRRETISRIIRQLAHERLRPEKRWKRVALQPMVNFDFFSRLYSSYRPDFATFHTNHVAHFQHTYWKAMEPDSFEEATTAEERRVYGDAILYGYQTADELLKRVLKLLDENTVLVVASSMGQKPFASHREGGKAIRQLRSLDRLLELVDEDNNATAITTMSDQFNIYPKSHEASERILGALKAAYVDRKDQPMFYAYRVEDSITVNLTPYVDVGEDSRCCFPHKGDGFSVPYSNLVYSTGMTKSGCHDPVGMMMMYGAGVSRGAHIASCNNLDIAPTLLQILGLPVPVEMTGRVLAEAFAENAALTFAR